MDVLKLLHGKEDRLHIVDGIENVAIGGVINHGVEDVVERSLRTFDLRRKERLLEIREFCFRLEEQSVQFFIWFNRRLRRERSRHERTVTLGTGKVLPNKSGSRIVADHSNSTLKTLGCSEQIER